MVTSTTSLTGSGVRDWIVQRMTAVILAAYLITLVYLCFTSGGLTYTKWTAMFDSFYMKAWTLAALVSLILHAWVGVWTILTDYVHHKCVRTVLFLALFIASIVYLAWGVHILWG